MYDEAVIEAPRFCRMVEDTPCGRLPAAVLPDLVPRLRQFEDQRTMNKRPQCCYPSHRPGSTGALSDRANPLLEAHRYLRRGPVSEERWSQLVAKDRDWERSRPY